VLEETDEELVKEARGGSADAFEALVIRYEARVRGLCRRILGSAADAEDAAVSAFVKAWRSLPRYAPGRSFAAWLLTIAAREAISLGRSRKVWRPLADAEASGLAACPGGAGGSPDPEAVAMAREEAHAVRQALAKLAPEARAAVVLRYQWDWSYRAIAEALRLPSGTVGALLHRAKRTLRQYLEEGSA
jgi:RNA polymerase sigma-70 factor (ECF subfamily)